MGIFLQSRLSDETIDSFQSAIAKAAAMPSTTDVAKVLQLSKMALSTTPAETRLDWKRISLVLSLLASLTVTALVEYHLGNSSIGERLFAWAERIFAVVIGLIGGEAAAKR